MTGNAPRNSPDRVEVAPRARARGRWRWRRDGIIAAVALGVAGLLLWRDHPLWSGLFLASFGLARLLVPPIALWVRKGLHAVAMPGGRGLHRRRVPLLGGVAIYVPTACLLVGLGVQGDARAWGLLAGATIVLLVGMRDDFKRVRPIAKVAAQVLAGLCLVAAGFSLPSLGIPGLGTLPLGVLEIPLLLFWIVLATNAMNLIDGMDGVAGSITFLAALAFASVGAWPIVAVVVAGATLGFLRHNLPPASVLLGDSGSLFLGFTLGALALLSPAYANVPLVAGMLAYALGDVALAVLRRFIRGKPLFVGDRSHVHHKLLDTFGYVPAALLAVVAFAGIQVVLAIAYPGVISLSVQVFLWIAMATLLMAAGQVNVGRMLESRAPFRRLHLVRAYVMGLMRLSTSRKDVERGLQRLLQDLDLASIHLGDIEIRNGPAVGELRAVPVALRTRAAGWSYVPAPEERTLDRERQTVVLELLREAERRLEILSEREVGRSGDTTPNNGKAPDAVLKEPASPDVPPPLRIPHGPNGAAAPRR